MRVHNGSIIQGQVIEYKRQSDESKEEILSHAIITLRERLSESMGGGSDDYNDIIVPFLPDTQATPMFTSTPSAAPLSIVIRLSGL